MNSENTGKDVTLTRPGGETRTFGPMPTFDALVVVAAARIAGHGAAIRPTGRRS